MDYCHEAVSSIVDRFVKEMKEEEVNIVPIALRLSSSQIHLLRFIIDAEIKNGMIKKEDGFHGKVNNIVQNHIVDILFNLMSAVNIKKDSSESLPTLTKKNIEDNKLIMDKLLNGEWEGYIENI